MARGVCEIEDGMLTGVTERTKIFKKARTPNTPRTASISSRWRATPSCHESLGLLGACAG